MKMKNIENKIRQEVHSTFPKLSRLMPKLSVRGISNICANKR